MLFFELTDKLNPGFTVEMYPAPQVIIGVHATHRLSLPLHPMVLPLGRSIRRLLGHAEDKDTKFRLRYGALAFTNQGLVIVRTTEQTANSDRHAAVAVNLLTEESEGEGLCYEQARAIAPKLPAARLNYQTIGAQKPEVIQNRLLIFKEGDAVRVRYFSELSPAAFELRWDGRWMHCRTRHLPKSKPQAA